MFSIFSKAVLLYKFKSIEKWHPKYVFYGKFNVKHKINWKLEWTGIASFDDKMFSCYKKGYRPVFLSIFQKTHQVLFPPGIFFHLAFYPLFLPPGSPPPPHPHHAPITEGGFFAFMQLSLTVALSQAD